MLPTLVIAALGVGASIFVWRTLALQQRVEVEQAAAVVAKSLARVIEARLEEDELGALRRQAKTLATPPVDKREWKTRAELLLSDHPAYRAVARMEGGHARDTAVSGDGRAMLREVSAKSATRTERAGRPGEVALGPIRLADGRVVLGIEIAVEQEAEQASVLFAVLEPAIALSRYLERSERSYTVRVLCGGEEVYRSTGSQPAAPADDHWAVERVQLSLGPEWSVHAHPTELIAGGTSEAGPLFALVAGLLISALIASLVHVSQTSRGRAAALVLSNDDLRERIDASARDALEIRRLNDVLEARVAQRTAELQETVAELETFNYSVSHDLRSPLGAILNFAAILEQDHGKTLEPSVREYLGYISESATTAVSLMDGLLAFSHSGREEIRKTEVDVHHLVASVVSEIAAANPALSREIKLGALPTAYADPAALRFVFFNLLSNACKFVRRGDSPRVEVAGYVEGGDTVYFVRDQGIGFDMRFAAKLFRVFERLHATDEYEGHGIGLAIVARLIRRHGGRAWAEGALGKGATFYFRIPSPPGEQAGHGI